MSAGSIVDILLPSPHPQTVFMDFLQKGWAGRSCTGASPWAAEDGSKENSIRLSREKKGHIPKEKWTSWLLYCCFSSVFLAAAAPLSLVEPQVLQGLFPGRAWSPGCVQSARLPMCPAPLDCCTLRSLLTKFLPFLVSLSRDFPSCIGQEIPESCEGDKPEAAFAPWV